MLQDRRSKLVKSRGMMSTVTPSLTPAPAAARAGAELRTARERLGFSIEDIAQGLRIRVPHLEALEAGRIAELPGNAYALAFVRAYAEALGLNPAEMVRRFKAEAAEVARPTMLDFPVPMPEREMPAGAALLLGLVLAIGVYAGWYHLSGEGRLPAETVTAIPQRLASLAEQALPSALAIKIRQVANVPVDPAEAAPQPVAPAPQQQAAAQVDPATIRVSTADPAPPVSPISPTSAAAAQLPPRLADPSPAAGALVGAGIVTDATHIVLRATADAWLMVKNRGGAILLNRTFKAGDTWLVPDRPDLLLTTGNAGGTEIVVDGTTIPSLAGNGAVRRDLPLDPEQIKDGRFNSAAAQQVASTRARQ